MVSVGDTVLLNVGDDVWRPLLVTKVHGPDEIAGEVFFYHPEDSNCKWAFSGTMFQAPSMYGRSCPVDHVERGDEMGQWRERGPISMARILEASVS